LYAERIARGRLKQVGKKRLNQKEKKKGLKEDKNGVTGKELKEKREKRDTLGREEWGRDFKKKKKRFPHLHVPARKTVSSTLKES